MHRQDIRRVAAVFGAVVANEVVDFGVADEVGAQLRRRQVRAAPFAGGFAFFLEAFGHH